MVAMVNFKMVFQTGCMKVKPRSELQKQKQNLTINVILRQCKEEGGGTGVEIYDREEIKTFAARVICQMEILLNGTQAAN